jgi:hypothetical protein
VTGVGASDPYQLAEQELIRSGRPKPKGDAWPRCVFDALIALAAAFPLVLLIGHSHQEAAWESDLMAMWLVVFGVGAASYAIRYHREHVWWRDYGQRAQMIAGDLARDEERRKKRWGS